MWKVKIHLLFFYLQEAVSKAHLLLLTLVFPQMPKKKIDLKNKWTSTSKYKIPEHTY